MTLEEQARAAIEMYYVGSGDDLVYECLEFIHPALVEVDGTTGFRRFVNYQLEPLTVTLETGSDATFYPAVFSIQRPEKNTLGRRDVQLTIAAVNNEMRQQLNAVREYQPKTQLKAVFRAYTENNLSYPGEIESNLTVSKPSLSDTEVSASLVYTDSNNKRFPSRDYTVATHPGLVDS